MEPVINWRRLEEGGKHRCIKCQRWRGKHSTKGGWGETSTVNSSPEHLLRGSILLLTCGLRFCCFTIIIVVIIFRVFFRIAIVLFGFLIIPEVQ